MTQDTPLMAALRAILTLLGTFLVGHSLLGHPLTTDLWGLISGSALTIAGAVTEIVSTNTTPTMIQSAIGTIVTAVGGVLLAVGVVNQQTWASIGGVITAIIPLFQKHTTKLTVMHVLNGKAVGNPKTGSVMKAVQKAAMLILLIGISFLSKAQDGCGTYNPADSVKYIPSGIWQWSIGELKEAAKEPYFKMIDYVSDKTTPYDSAAFSNIIDRFIYWREVVDLKLSDKKERSDFSNWLVSEARAAGKLNYQEDKPTNTSGTVSYSYISKMSPDTSGSGDLSGDLYSEGRRLNYSSGFKFVVKHKPDPTHLHLLSGKLGNPPSGTDTTTWQGFEAVSSVVLYAYSPSIKQWISLAGLGIGYGKYIWKTSSTGTGYWYCQWEVSGLGYAGGALGSTPSTPTSLSGLGAIGVTGSFINKYITVGVGWDLTHGSPLYTVGSNFSIFN
jgi:hypothetical protein